jgi:hypothetical protein
LGDDACLLEDDVRSKASHVADDAYWDNPEASNHVDMLVDKLAKGVADERSNAAIRSVKVLDKSESLDLGDGEGGRAPGMFNTVLEPVLLNTDSSVSVDRVAETEVTDPPVFNGPRMPVDTPNSPGRAPLAAKSAPVQRKRTMSCPPVSRPGLSGPWSLEWLQDQTFRDAGLIFSAKKGLKKGHGEGGDLRRKAVRGPLMNQDGGFLRNSLYSLKRIARLPINDRREVMQILQKTARRRKHRGVASCLAKPILGLQLKGSHRLLRSITIGSIG